MLRKNSDGKYEYTAGVAGNIRAVVAPWSVDGVTRWEGLGAQLVGAGVGVLVTLFAAPKIMKHAKKNNPAAYAFFNRDGGYDSVQA